MLELTLRIGFSLAVVFVLMWGLAKVVRRPLAGRGSDVLSVVTRQQLSRGASVAVLKVAGRAIVVGVTDQQVTLLAEARIEEIEGPQAAAAVHRSPVDLASLEPTGLAFTEPTVQDLATAERAEASYRLAAQQATEKAAPQNKLAGSALSPQTWLATIDFLRERTVRR
jgi:flagellar protein FliO/FliZ